MSASLIDTDTLSEIIKGRDAQVLKKAIDLPCPTSEISSQGFYPN